MVLLILTTGGFEIVIPESKLIFELEKYSRQSKECETDPNNCIKIEVEYPVAVQGPRQAVQAINNTIGLYVRKSLAVFAVDGPESLPLAIDEIADQLLLDYDEFSKKASVPWTIETKGKVLLKGKNAATIQLDNFTYTGGAHPNSFRHLINFDTHSGKVLMLEDLITDLDILKILVENRFREHHGLSSDANLNEAGFFWDKEFDLAANFGLTESGLYFYYNPYEIAAYVFGATELMLPYDDLRGILVKKYLP